MYMYMYVVDIHVHVQVYVMHTLGNNLNCIKPVECTSLLGYLSTHLHMFELFVTE